MVACSYELMQKAAKGLSVSGRVFKGAAPPCLGFDEQDLV